MTATRRALLVAAPATALSALGLVAVIGVATIGANLPSGRQPAAAGTPCTALSGDAEGLDPAQQSNAKIITGVAMSRGLGPVGAAIGVTVALAESTLYNYANDGSSTLTGSADGQQLTGAERAVARESLNDPHDKVGNHLDSIGLFQQRPMTGWGSPAQLIDPATSAGLFYDRLAGERDETTWHASTNNHKGAGLLTGGGRNFSEQTRTRAVLATGEIRGFPEGTMLIFYKGLDPMLVQMTAY